MISGGTAAAEDAPADAQVPAAAIVAAFGGIRPMAAKLGIAVSTVQGWKQRDAIPRARLPQIRAAAAAHGVALGPHEPPAPEPPSAAPSDPPPAAPAAPAAPAPEPPVAAPPPVLARASPWRVRAPVLALAAFLLLAAGIGAVAWDARAKLGALAEREALLARRLAAIEERGAPDAGLGRRLTALEEAAQRSRPETATAANAAEIASLRARIEALARERAEAPAAGGAALAALAARLDETAAALATLRSEVARSGASGTRMDADVARALMLAAAAGRLRAAIAAGRGFTDELAAARTAAAASPALLAALAKLAEGAGAERAGAGVPDRARLVAELPDRATAALAAMRAQAGEGWTARTLARLAGVVSVRRVGAEVAGEDAEALIARAEARAGAGALAGAVAELDRLPPPAAAAFAPWLADARALLAAEAALAALDAEAAEALAAAARRATER